MACGASRISQNGFLFGQGERELVAEIIQGSLKLPSKEETHTRRLSQFRNSYRSEETSDNNKNTKKTTDEQAEWQPRTTNLAQLFFSSRMRFCEPTNASTAVQTREK
eukprot:m.192915 g.192915  ORF g.192915 m.192915 type:complete len:107 (-) comp53671_c2_seq1:213-533(-)